MIQPPSSTDEQRAIDIEIAKLELKGTTDTHTSHQARVCALRRRRNKLSPIAKLPSELLTYAFFLFILAKDEHEHGRIQWSRRDHALAPITHVCFTWREEALGCPLLWSTISLHRLSLTWLDEYIKRSHKSPLDISGEFDASSLLDTVGEMEAKLTFLRSLIQSSAGPRIRDLAIRAYGMELDGIYSLVSTAAVHAPNIENIIIRYKAELGLRPSTKRTVDLSSIFREDLSQLRNLTILGFPIRWPDKTDATTTTTITHALLPNRLTKLVLNNVSLIKTGGILDLLSFTPSLYSLELGEPPAFASFRDPSGDSVPENLIVPLDNLTLFAFHGSLKRCLSLLSHIRYPAASTRIIASIRWDTSDGTSSPATLTGDVKQLFEFCGTITHSPPCGFEVDVELGHSASFRFYDRTNTTGSCGYTCTQRAEPMAAITVCSIGGNAIQELLGALIPTLPLSSVEQLGLANSIDKDMAGLIMSHTPQTIRLKVSSNNILPYCAVLGERDEAGSHYLPLLKEIWICHADFSFMPELGRLGCVSLINPVLIGRRDEDEGTKIRTVVLKDNLGLSEVMVKAILDTGAVDEVVWVDLLTQEVRVLKRDTGLVKGSGCLEIWT